MRSKFRGKRIDWLAMLCAAFFTLHFSLFTSCKQKDDVVQTVPARKWVEKTVAVVAPIGDAATKTRLERTAGWFQQNLREAQLRNQLAVSLKIEWYDEMSEDLTTLSQTLAGRDDIVAVIGPFANEGVAQFAPACKNTMKPLIAPTATSEDIIRRYAVTTSGVRTNLSPFLWSLTQTDVELTGLLMSSYATISQYLNGLIGKPQVAIFAPDDVYGKTFNYWAPFYALEDNITLRCNQQYTSTEHLLKLVEAYRNDMKDHAYTSSAIFCVAETARQMSEIARSNRRAVLSDPTVAAVMPSSDPDDPANDAEWLFFKSSLQTYFAYTSLSEEVLEALGQRGVAMLQGYEGFSPYADPSTGFELSYKTRFGILPTFAECKFYDALMLAAFAASYVEHHPAEDADGSLDRQHAAFNQAIVNINKSAIASTVDGSAWSTTGMENYLSAMERGQVLRLVGASGPISFDAETYTATTSTTYVQWQIMDGKIIHRSYFGNTGGRNANAKAAWLYLYNEQRAIEDFMKQAGIDVGMQFDYPSVTGRYAVLVQGSGGYGNYRHQADVLNVYQALRREGFPDDHIILVIDKALAQDSQNPEPGIIRALPDGPDLLGGTTAGSGMAAAEVDYDNSTMTAQDIADILAGRTTSRLPVVVPQDEGQNVLFYWSGHGESAVHGGADEFCWRDAAIGQGFTASLLRQTAQQMKYRKLLIIAEPCYGECVIRAIDGLPGVLAMSGASTTEQSWADGWSNTARIWMCDRFTLNVVNCLKEKPHTNFRDFFIYCAQHTLGSHAKIVNAGNFDNLYTASPDEFFIYGKAQQEGRRQYRHKNIH